MARRKGSKNRVKRKAPRTPYETYSDWYDKYTKGDKSKLFSKKLKQYTNDPLHDKESFEYWYRRAKAKGYANPARKVAMEQEYVDRSMERGLRKIYGDDMPDLSTKKARMEYAQQYVDQLVLEKGISEADAWEEFREYFY